MYKDSNVQESKLAGIPEGRNDGEKRKSPPPPCWKAVFNGLLAQTVGRPWARYAV